MLFERERASLEPYPVSVSGRTRLQFRPYFKYVGLFWGPFSCRRTPLQKLPARFVCIVFRKRTELSTTRWRRVYYRIPATHEWSGRLPACRVTSRGLKGSKELIEDGLLSSTPQPMLRSRRVERVRHEVVASAPPATAVLVLSCPSTACF